MNDGTYNAFIERTTLGFDYDGRIFSLWLHLRGDGWGQGFGGHTLDDRCEIGEERPGTQEGHQYIINVLRTLEVDYWEDLKGKPIRFKSVNGTIEGIGHYYKDKWFYPKDLWKDDE